MKDRPVILAIETSCDDTAVAVVQNHPLIEKRILSHVLYTQIEEHAPYGGVVPELSARSHLQFLPVTIQKALDNAKLSLTEVDAIAVTAGPGLIGGVLVGVTVAKALAFSLRKPLICINHLEGHALTIRLTHHVDYPYLLLLASGGHCQFVEVKSLGQYKILGETLDDSAGEAFDKVAKMMDLGYPGGPLIERIAEKGNINQYPMIKVLYQRQDCSLSFSGLKTYMRLLIEKEKEKTQKVLGEFILTQTQKQDLAACFQHAVMLQFKQKIEYVMGQMVPALQTVVIAGGVASNRYICNHLKEIVETHQKTFIFPPSFLCTDNAAMIGWAALERLERGLDCHLDFDPRPRWPLDSL